MLTTEIQQGIHTGPVTLNPRWLRIPSAVKYSGLSRSRLYELLAQQGGPRGQPLTYDLGTITERVHDLLGLSLLLRSTTSWRPEINGKRSFDMIALLGPPSKRALAGGSF